MKRDDRGQGVISATHTAYAVSVGLFIKKRETVAVKGSVLHAGDPRARLCERTPRSSGDGDTLCRDLSPHLPSPVTVEVKKRVLLLSVT